MAGREPKAGAPAGEALGAAPKAGAPPQEGVEPILVLDDVTVRVRDRRLLPHTNWTIRPGEQWAVLGPNGSGKSTLARTIAGVLPSAAGHVRTRAGQRAALVSFEAQAELYAREIELDHARHFAARPGEVLTARGLLNAAGGESRQDDVAKDREGAASSSTAGDGLDIDHLLDRPFRHLSAGEMRKTLVARALASAPTLLVLDEPFDGLDERSRRLLSGYLERLIEEGRHIILVTHRVEELLPGVTHLLMLRDGRVAAMGPKSEMLDPRRLEGLYGAPHDVTAENSPRRGAAPAARGVRAAEVSGARGEKLAPLVELEGVNVRYGELTVLRNLSWRVMPGERWVIVGPNGSGKTTILELIVGDNLQGYANVIRLFGRRKGSGESVWEIKRRIGIVTPRLQLGYRHSATGLEVVISGLFDSIGLYRRPSPEEIERAEGWLERLAVAELAARHFSRLSNGQRRLLLIARAMVKEPELLILDEPCQGLDPRNRRRVLDAVDAACNSASAALIYVTHHDDEHPRYLTHTLRLSGPGAPAIVDEHFGSA